MKRNIAFIIVFILVSMFFVVKPALTTDNTEYHLSDYTTISVSEAKELILNTSNLYLLDVRTQSEFDAGYIEGAYLIPHTEIQSRTDELPTNKSDPILVYCRSGRRSADASQILIDLEFQRVFNMDGGIIAWKDAGYEIIVISASNPFYAPEFYLSVISLVLIIMGTILAIRRKE
jgi:rhodanese-related sulfurtransferase